MGKKAVLYGENTYKIIVNLIYPSRTEQRDRLLCPDSQTIHTKLQQTRQGWEPWVLLLYYVSLSKGVNTESSRSYTQICELKPFVWDNNTESRKSYTQACKLKLYVWRRPWPCGHTITRLKHLFHYQKTHDLTPFLWTKTSVEVKSHQRNEVSKTCYGIINESNNAVLFHTILLFLVDMVLIMVFERES